MHALVAFLKGAVTRIPNPGVYGCYVVKGGNIYAFDRSAGLQAGVPMESDVDFNVPAEALDKALARMKEVQAMTVEDDGVQGTAVTIKSGRLRATIKCNTDPAPDIPTLGDEWTACPQEFTAGLALAIPFLGERGWSMGIRLKAGRMTALNNASMIDISIPGLALDGEVLLTKAAAEFLIAQGVPDQYQTEGSAISFRWDDGRWVRTQLLNDKMQASVDDLIERTFAPIKKWFDIDDEFREAYADAVALSDDRLVFTDAGFDVRKADMDSHVDFARLPPGHRSYWDHKIIGKVLGCAARWNPTPHPAGCPFTGDNFRGIVMGIAKWM